MCDVAKELVFDGCHGITVLRKLNVVVFLEMWLMFSVSLMFNHNCCMWHVFVT